VPFTVLSIGPATLPDGRAGYPYSQTLNAAGGSGGYTFTAAGTLLAGLSLSPQGVLTGTLAAPGSYSFTVTAADSEGNSASQDYTIQMNSGVAIATSNLANWTVDIAGYSQTLAANGGTGTITFLQHGQAATSP